MSDQQNAAEMEETPPKKKSKLLLIALVLALLLGGGAFYGVYSGMIPLPFGGEPEVAEGEAGESEGDGDGKQAKKKDHVPIDQVAFLPLDEMVISLGPDAKSRHLKMRLSIEVAPESLNDVTTMTPRILDVLNTFLRAVDERDFELPRGMLRLRAQMLRRVQLVTPQGAVRDVLIQEFVLN